MNATTVQPTGIKILVVDDTATNRQILAAFLKKLGFSVIMAEDGAQGVDKFLNETPDIVLMDVMMPVMDGYEATRRIKAASGERWVPVIFLSALDKEENLVAGLDAGGDDYLHKPVNFVILDAKLRSMVRTLELQKRLDGERRRIESITSNLVDGVINIDEHGLIQWVNPAVQQIFGYRPGELIGHNIKMLMPEQHREAHDGYIQHYLSTGESKIIGRAQRLVFGRRKDGAQFPMELGVSENVMAGQRQFVGVVRDITERTEAENQLRENAKRLQDYHDTQETENALAQDIVERQMLRTGLSDPSVGHWISPTANFSGDIVAATRGRNGDLYVLLADATGHGLGAAICTLPVLSVFYSLAETGVSLPVIITEVNRQLLATMPVGRFVAASLLRVDSAKGKAEVWIGGTPDMLLLDTNGNTRRSLAANHLPLGVIEFDEAESLPEEISIAAGEQFVLFSDGLLEATNAANEQFGLGNLFAALSSAPRDERLLAVKANLKRHLGDLAPHDDVSLMLINC